ncbi:alpha/beta hydrolase-fold protein [Xenophilus arseniciresistens]|uniref:Alpha/beta hydrolase-fold protein n=1 Tax=Xenophilus arseniciresistens TaxID=1283306 RepID=A0AAE3NE88_9BURK|nr:alpha/beta hydrolase-fold protein [Xenophilus arseniciresistens]MDA7419246.1 alpha/beta hydrolase-fold protein [Xenophilus arseniciresistens]
MSGAAEKKDWPAVSWPGTQLRRLRAKANGFAYRVQIWLPPGEAPAAGFPAICVLDGQALFGTFVEGIRRASRRPDATGVVPMAVIAIAHEAEAEGEAPPLYAENLRRRDFTAGPCADEPAPADAASVGGAPAFLSFLVDELMPALTAELPLDPARQTLFGHSLAGHFVLQALALRPAAFACWAAISPSVWWDEEGLRRRLCAALPHADRPRLLMAVGEYEGEVPPWQRTQPGYEQLVARRARRQMVASAQALAQEIGPRFDEDEFSFRIFPEEDHASILMIAAQRVMRFCSRP